MSPPASETAAITLFAPAKINLSLHVFGVRADSYHELAGLVAFADVGDELTLAPAPDPEKSARWSLQVEGPFAGKLQDEMPDRNLVMKAARLFAAHQDARNVAEGPPARFTLVKNLPVASGIGGGSADAAAALAALQHYSQVTLPEEVLAAFAKQLGADVSMCLVSRAQYVLGTGEIRTLVELAQPLPAVLVNPAIAVSTGAVFGQLAAPPLTADFKRREPELPVDRSPRGIIQWLAGQRNDLEATAMHLAPAVGKVLGMLSDTSKCRLARMSGSGATCFGLFETKEAATEAAQAIKTAQPDWWVVATGLR